MAGVDGLGLPRRRLLAAGGLGITSMALPDAARAASPAALSAETSVATVTVTATEAGRMRVEWDDSGGFTYDLNYQRIDGPAATVEGVTSPHELMPSDWTASDDSAVYSVHLTTRQGATSFNSAPSNVTLTAAAAGGTVTSFTGDGTVGLAGVTYRVHTFTAGGTLTVHHARDVEYLLVGGGGGGGTRHGGGGGGGGVVTGTASLIAGSETIAVGSGGAGMSRPDQSAAGTAGASGGTTTAFGTTAAGGGRGGGSLHGPSDGGSGGGSNSTSFAAGAASPSGQGSSGGAGISGSSEGGFAGGGGGGAAAAGGTATGGGSSDGQAGDGGTGVVSTISGASVRYAGGGGGSLSPLATGTAGAGGAGGGGAGSSFGWTLYNAAAARPTLAWTLSTYTGDNPTTVEQFDALITGATFFRSGRAVLTSQSSSGTLTNNVLNWTDNDDLESVLGLGNVVEDRFALVVTGTFIPAETGTYWFTLESDDSADLRLDATTVVSFYGGRGISSLGSTVGSISLTAGTAYSIRVRMQEGAVNDGLRVFWQKPSQRSVSTSIWYQDATEVPGTSPNSVEDLDRLISASTATSAGLAAITTGTDGVDAGINVLNWGDATELATATGATVPNSGDDFALVVIGTLVPTETGTYTFTLAGDDAVDLAVDGSVIVAHYGNHAAPAVGARTGTAVLTAGVPVRLVARQHQASGGETLRVFWRKPSQASGWHQDAAELTAVGRHGTDGLGGGGGAGGFRGFSGTANADGGDGGDGVVIVRYRHDAA